MSEVFVETFTHLKDKPKADRALPILQKIASLVKPIMRKHAWELPVLAEFFPENPNLLGLNINGGQKICIRLRPYHAPDTFYDEDDLVQTMLHELTHNVHGPHDDRFYKFLSELQDEYDALQRSGYAGEGFFSNGTRLGVNVSHNLPPHMARAKALEAAEKRRQRTQVLGASGRRLGGRIDTKNLSPRVLAAQAAERRARDEKSCASGALAEAEAAKAAKDSIEDRIIDLTVDDFSDPEPISQKRPAPPGQALDSRVKRASTSHPINRRPYLPETPPVRQDPSAYKSNASPSQAASEWPCPTCTLLNTPMALQCDACSTIRPQAHNSGWACLTCGEADIPHERWMCRFCGAVKTSS